MLASVLVAVCAGFLSPVQSLGGHRVGRIFIEGNDQTRDRVILECLPFVPGQKLRQADLLAGQEKLRRCGLFPVNPWRGIGPTVEVLPNEIGGEFLDVRVRVNERPGNWLRCAACEVLMTAALASRAELGFALWSLFDDARDRITHKQP